VDGMENRCLKQNMEIVITHPEMGIYLGNCLGLGFWTLIDPVGQPEATTFPDADTARTHIASWDENNDPTDYSFVEVASGSILALKAAGLEPLMGDMVADAVRYGGYS
jgi:hypothetical protein